MNLFNNKIIRATERNCYNYPSINFRKIEKYPQSWEDLKPKYQIISPGTRTKYIVNSAVLAANR